MVDPDQLRHRRERSWIGWAAVRPRRIYETVVYATEYEAAAAFYRDVLGLREVEDGAFRLDDDAVLLLFDPTRSSQPGRGVPSHGPTGAVHVAFSVGEGELDAWRERLRTHEVEIEQENDWPQGGYSIYVRDPAGNSVELVDGDLWPK
jgi:catechol 2,3-dioxygenase-like lactoylglutathione lyase family enzyme